MVSIYSNDENDLGLKFVDTIDFSDGYYQFDYTGVWKNDAGQLFLADDSGCSCPSPFEDFTKLEQFTPVTVAELQEYLTERDKTTYEAPGSRELEIADLITKLSY